MANTRIEDTNVLNIGTPVIVASNGSFKPFIGEPVVVCDPEEQIESNEPQFVRATYTTPSHVLGTVLRTQGNTAYVSLHDNYSPPLCSSEIVPELKGLEKMFNRKFNCNDCIHKNDLGDWLDYKPVKNIDCKRLCNDMSGKFNSISPINNYNLCDMFQITPEMLHIMKVKDREIIDPKQFIDPHPIIELKNGMKIIL